MSSVLISYCQLNSLLPETLYQKYWSYLPAQEQGRLERLRQPGDRDLSFLGKLLLVEQLKNWGYGPLSLAHLKYTDHKRPYLDAAIDFNISHTTGLVMCAAGENLRVGIDCERLITVDPAQFAAFFSPDERVAAETSPRRFFELWCRKEALIKAIGVGVYADLTEMSVLNESYQYGEETYYFYSLPVPDDYCAVLVCNQPGVQLFINVIHPLDLEQKSPS